MRCHTADREPFNKHSCIAHAEIGEKKMTEKVSIAIIGGSGLYHMAGLQDTKEYNVDTPFGTPSAPIMVGTMENWTGVVRSC